MTDETLTSADRAFRTHGSFDRVGDYEYEATTTPFEGRARVAAGDDTADGDAAVEVTVRAPTLDAVVEGETVAEVVEDGWFETLERRLEGAHKAAKTDDVDPAVVSRADGEVEVVFAFGPTAARADVADDALAVVEFVEGTWMQGIVPGYEYREPAAGLIERARQHYDDGGAGGAGGPL